MRSEGCSTWSVCVCAPVSLSAAILALQGTRRPYEWYQRLQNYANLKKCRNDSVREIMLWKQVKKPMCIIEPAYLDRSACSLYLVEAQEVTMKALPHRHASSLVSDSPWPTNVETTSKRILIAQPYIMRRGFALQCFSYYYVFVLHRGNFHFCLPFCLCICFHSHNALLYPIPLLQPLNRS